MRAGRLPPPALILLCLTGLAVEARAQDQPVVFLHGLASNSDGWIDTASRLHQGLAIDTHTPDFNWRESYPDQANTLAARPELAWLPGAPILIGHSNGGIVSRQWTRSRPAAGVITLGTPHRGAPLLPHFFQWTSYHAATPSLLNSVLSRFSDWTDWTWVFWYVNNALNFFSDYSIWSVVSVGTTLGIDLVLPVTAQMHPYSFYLNDLNSWDNQSREARDVPNRVGIVSVAHNYYWAGPARAAVPDSADAIAAGLYGAAYGMLYWGEYILIQADPADINASRQGLSLINLARHMLDIDPTYCLFVSSVDLSECIANDGVVPYTSQEFPGAPNLYLGGGNDGPAHVVERQRSEDALYQALRWYMHVPVRALPPSPLPPGSGPGSPTVESGSGVESGGPDNSSVPSGDTPASPTIYAGQALRPGESITSDNGLYRLRYDDSGDLVLFDEWGGYPMWTSGTQGSFPGVVLMQGDGNFVIYDGNGSPIWSSSNSLNHPGAHLVVQDDGNVVIYDVDGTALWFTGTAR